MLELYPHNQKAYDNAKFIFETENKTAIIHPTGTGKSLIVAKFILENPKAKFLFISPSNFIHKEVKKHIGKNFHNVIFQTYQYFIFNDIDAFVGFDFIILDEFHRVGAEQWNKKIEDLLSINPTAKQLGTTATHIRYLDDERDMAEELFDGNISSYMTLGTSIEIGIHKKPIYISALYNIREIIDDTEKRLKKTNREKELENLKSRKVVWEESNGIDFIINKHLTQSRKKIIIFCKNFEHTQYIENLIKPILQKFYNYNVEFNKVHSKFGSTNKKVFSHFENSKTPQVLFSIDMLNEGIHVKGVDTIMMFRDTASPIIYFQQMGRCFTVGQKLRPLLFDFVNNFNIKNSVGSIVKNFYNDFEEANEEQYFKKRNLIIDFYDESLDFQGFINEFSHTRTWYERYSELKEFIQKKGRLPLWHESTWLVNQRQKYKIGKLSNEEIKLLKDIDKNILNTITLKDWNYRYNELKNFYKENGRLPVYRENKWLTNQKQAYKEGKLSKEQIKFLEEINKDIFLNQKKKWEEYYLELKIFFDKHKDLPQEKSELSEWVYQQQVSKKLSQQKKDLLIELKSDFFIIKKRLSKEENFEQLKDFFLKNRRLPTHRESSFLQSMRKRFNKGLLSEEDINKMEQINEDIFERRFNKTWEESFEEFKKGYEEKRKMKIEIKHWFSQQKSIFKNGKLAFEKINLFFQIDKNIFS